MKKVLLLCLIVVAAIHCRASDTLTLRQIYNFDIGDTFDYKSTDFVFYLDYVHYSYSRYAVSDKWFSTDGDTVYYQRSLLYPHTGLDTIKYYALDSNMVFVDTLKFIFTSSPEPVTISTFSLDTFATTTRIQNHLSCFSFESSIDVQSVQGLGQVRYQQWTGSPDDYAYSEQKLIRYHKGNEIWGIPYDIASGITDIAGQPAISVYPSPAADVLHVKIDSHKYPMTFQLIDVYGQEVYKVMIDASETAHHIASLASGVYVWRLGSDFQTIYSGRIIKQ